MCLHLLIRQQKLYRGFYGNDLAGIIRLVASKWYYIAFVFDSVTRTQSIYLDGILPGCAACYYDELIEQKPL